MNWVQILPALMAAVVILMAPGVLFAYLAGLRGVPLWGVSGPVSIALLAIESVVFPFIGLGWTPLTALIGAIILSIGLGVLFNRLLSNNDRASRVGPRWQVEWRDIGIATAGGCVLSAALILSIGNPTHFNQAFDNVFHLNAIRFVMEEGSASPFDLGYLIHSSNGSSFYPSGWHGINALVAMFAGVSIPVANNGVLLAICLVIWPAGLLFLARKIFGAGIEVAIGIAIFTPAFMVFPLHLLYFGPLMPLILATALLPTAFALTLELLKVRKSTALNNLGAFVLLLGVLAGVGIAHPGGFLAWLAMTNLAALVWLLQKWATLTARSRIVSTLGVTTLWTVSVFSLWKLRPSDQDSSWGPNASALRAASDLVTGGLLGSPASVNIAIFVTVGLVSLWVARFRAPQNAYLLLWFAALGFLYFVAQAQTHGKIRELIVGTWYQDPHRLGMFVVIPMILVAAAGFVFVWRLLKSKQKGPLLAASLALLVIAGMLSLVSPQVRTNIALVRPLYILDQESILVSDDELALLKRLPNVVPDTSVIAGNPWQGAGMAYALSARQVLMPHMLVPQDSDRDLIMEKLNVAEAGSPVCDAISRTNVGYVLDFPGPMVLGKGKTFSGLEGLEHSAAVKLIDTEGEAKLYRVIACS